LQGKKAVTIFVEKEKYRRSQNTCHKKMFMAAKFERKEEKESMQKNSLFWRL